MPIRCIVGDEVDGVLKEVHARDCGKDQRGLKLFKQIVHLDYYWPTLEADDMSFA